MSWIPPAYSPGSLAHVGRAARRTAEENRILSDRLSAVLRERHDAGAASLWGSGTDALTALLTGLVAQGRRRVAVPAYACYDLASSVLASGAEAVFYDVDPESLQPSSDSLGQALDGAGAQAILVAPLYGLPLDVGALEEEARERGVPLVMDAAQAFETYWCGREMASWGDAAILSFGRGKGWTAGAGGALLLRGALTDLPTPTPVGAASTVRPLVQSALQELLARPAAYGFLARLPWLRLGETIFHPPHPPRPPFPAMAGLALDNEAEARSQAGRRRDWGAGLAETLAGNPGAGQPISPPVEGRPAYLRFPLLLSTGSIPTSLRRLGVARGYPKPLPTLDPWVGDVPQDAFPGARQLADRLVTLPTHSRLPDRDPAAYAARVRRGLAALGTAAKVPNA